jgi:membrane-associated phospholipid phosphatase
MPASPDWTSRPVALLQWGAAFAFATALAIFVLDAPLARLLAQWEPASFWGKLLTVLEWPAGLQLKKRVYLIGPIELNATRWAGALLLGAGTAGSLAVPRFRAAARGWALVFFTHLLARLAMVEIKEATERLRPAEWLNAGGGPTFWVKGGLSFPSGHVTYFLSLLLPAAIVFPRWRKPLLAIVALVAACRVAENAHFASDVLGAVALVCLVCFAVAAALPPWRWRRASASPG